MGKSNKNKDAFLGMPHGTATNRLRKMIMFDLLKRLGEDFCYRCENIIENVDDLSVEHKKPWLWNDKKLFWDLDNIAFSHLKCNIANRPRGIDKNCKEGFHWCNGCKKCLPVKAFGANNQSMSGLKLHCRDCRKKGGWGHPERTKDGQKSR